MISKSCVNGSMSRPWKLKSDHMLLVFGSFVQDYVWRCERFARPGETLVGSFATGPGGKGSNQAIAAARMGHAVTFLSAVGRDAGALAARALHADNGSHAHWIESDAPTASAGIVVDAQGHNTIVLDLGANLAIQIADLEERTHLFDKAEVLLCQLECAPAATLHALHFARARGIRTMLNPAPVMAGAMGRTWLDLVDVLTPNETEFQALIARELGHDQIIDPVLLDDATLHQLCRRLKVPVVVITLGAHGVFASTELEHWRLPAEAVKAVDTTGAGDAFNGALAAAMAERKTWTLRQQICYASQVAALAVEKPGAALAMPRLLDWQVRFAG
jgi:ribokinase